MADIEHNTYQLPPLLNSAPANHLIGRINSSCGPPSSPISDPKIHIYFLHGVDFINQDKTTTEEILGKKCIFLSLFSSIVKVSNFFKNK